MNRMIVLLPLILLSNKLDYSNPAVLLMLRAGFVGVVAVVLALYALMYQKVQAKNDRRAIFVPVTLPFQPPQVKETTYYEHEMAEIKKAAQGAVMNGLIMGVLVCVSALRERVRPRIDLPPSPALLHASARPAAGVCMPPCRASAAIGDALLVRRSSW